MSIKESPSPAPSKVTDPVIKDDSGVDLKTDSVSCRSLVEACQIESYYSGGGSGGLY